MEIVMPLNLALIMLLLLGILADKAERYGLSSLLYLGAGILALVLMLYSSHNGKEGLANFTGIQAGVTNYLAGTQFVVYLTKRKKADVK
ncbi:MAG: hypothetical protein WC471_02995 [Candidatus Woesearchaeota archaeon]